MHYQERKMWHTADGSFTPAEWRERQLAQLRASAERDKADVVVVAADEQAEAYAEALQALAKLRRKWRRRQAMFRSTLRAEANLALQEMLARTLQGMGPLGNVLSDVEEPFELSRRREPPESGVRETLRGWLRSRLHRSTPAHIGRAVTKEDRWPSSMFGTS